MGTDLWFELTAFFGLLAASAFFSGSETALIAASRARLAALKEGGNRRADLVISLREKKEELIGALLLGNNFVNILASALATSVLMKAFGEKGVAIATVGVTALVLIFAEVMPKTYAIMNPDRLALFVAPFVRALVAVSSPVTRFIARFVSVLFRLFGVDTMGHSSTAHEEELRGAIELFKGTEKVQGDSGETGAMLRSIMDLADVSVEKVMVHRRNVNMINIATPVAQIVNEVLHSAYTRIPVWKDSQDNIVGVVHTKLLLQELSQCNGDMTRVDVTNAMMEPWFIPESTTLFDQLQAFRRRREHLAMVVDEYGALTGMITMEDVLEEIVGQIDDEHDVTVPGVRPQTDGTFIVDGKVTLRDLKRDLNWRLPDEEYATVAGLLLFESQRIPQVGQLFNFYDFRFEILKKQRNQITLVRVTPPLLPVESLAAEAAAGNA